MTSQAASFDEAVATLLTPGGLDLGGLDTGLRHALGPGIDYADLYFQRTWQEGWVLEDGEVKEASYNIDGGVTRRALDRHDQKYQDVNDSQHSRRARGQ